MDYLFKDVCPVINVPFNEDESIQYEGIDKIVDFVVESGCKSVCLFAFNSEPHKMTLEEKKSVIKYFLKSVNGRIQTVIGLIDNSIKGVIELGDLSGLANDGSTANSSNFYDIEFKIGPLPFNMRCELKSLYFYLEYKEE